MRASPKANLNNDQRQSVLHLLLVCLREGKLPHGSFQFVAGKFGVTRSTIRLIWLRAQVDLNNVQRICESVASQKELPKTSRTMMCAVAAGLGIPTTTLHAYYKRGAIVYQHGDAGLQLHDAAVVLQEVIKAAGDNNYKIPHMGKKKLALAGKLPETVACDPTVFNDGCTRLGEEDIDKRLRVLSQEIAEALEMAEICNLLEDMGL
ncbi:hypothetical protein DYB28_003432 [Aphanomyces astaci]|uniref:DUF7769 domain-containing protein n=1 Tax=Aphanomyces astaci TaxID=112090 RepID=A0A397EJ67_APHAT|nr:hypothetical protein DYB26_006987 [Aphanomyces astaci]RHY88339.1 hypothetical protein DYB31_010534 [Aphanomyces astaci]RLO10408.1 hypothetical protein DYB28_003432 [Aphanomyces astaci]